MGKFKPSKFQKEIFKFISKEDGSGIIEAVAGSGKSTTIVESLHLIPSDKRVGFFAFNKSIAEELASRVPSHVQALTLNSLGMRAWVRYAGRLNVEGKKTKNLLNKHFADKFDEYTFRRLVVPVCKLVGICKAVGLVPTNFHEHEDEAATGLVEDNLATWEKLINHFDIEFSDRISFAGKEFDPERIFTNETFEVFENKMVPDKYKAIALARQVLAISLATWETIDFDDMLYLPVVFGAPVQRFDFVFVDEAQDVSDIQRALLKSAMKKRGRLIAVGDPAQAIYGFRGADSEALNNIARQFDAKSLPLSISYRCPKLVVAEAQKYVSHIQSHESAPEGIVKRVGEYKHTMFREDDLVVCRLTAPLIQLAYHLIGNKVAATILGRDMGKGLITLIERKLKAQSIDDLINKLKEWSKKELERLRKDDPDADTSRVEDKYNIIMTFIEFSGADTIPTLIKAINDLFNSDSGGVRLATIHRSKGLEAERVLILDAFLMPSKHARLPWQKKQEGNLAYVAITRAMSELIYIRSPRLGTFSQNSSFKPKVKLRKRSFDLGSNTLSSHLDNTVGSSNGLNVGLFPEDGYD